MGNRSCFVRHSFCVVLVCALAAVASADTLVCKDGKKVSGEVSQIGSIYVVKTGSGQTVVPVASVKQWIKGEGTADTTATPPTPTSKPTAGGTSNAGRPTTKGSVAKTTDSPKPKDPKKVTRYAAAFAVSPTLLVTAAAPLDKATEIHLQGPDGGDIAATVVKIDAASGLATLRTTANLKAFYSIETAFIGGAVDCPAFCEIDIFDTRATIIGGEAKTEGTWSLKMDKSPTFAGSPLIVEGKVVGVELATAISTAESVPVATLEQLTEICGDLGDVSNHSSPPGASGAYQVIISAEGK